MTQQRLTKTIDQMSFEEALLELESIVKRLEGGKENLETAIDDYELGNLLREHCEKKLKEAQMRVDKIIQKTDGTLTLEPAKLD
jgi:exodeoxyribonuclease VII small subunit